MALSDEEMDRRWVSMRNAIILAVHQTMIESEFKDQFVQNLNHYLSESRQHDADTFLRKYLSDNPEDQAPDE